MTSSQIAADAAPVSDSTWARVASKRIFFGHQSVGGNILQGLEELAGGASVPLRIVASDRPDTVSGPALIHAAVGRNGDPRTKLAAFLGAAGRPEAAVSVAMVKFCYLDITPATDPDSLFRDYRAAVEQLRQANPEATIVHITAPLTAEEGMPKRLLKKVLGRATVRDANRRRERYNALLRTEFEREPLFDLAALESTRPDGGREASGGEADRAYALAPAYTDDGGHLNALGRRIVANRFLDFLAGLGR